MSPAVGAGPSAEAKAMEAAPPWPPELFAPPWPPEMSAPLWLPELPVPPWFPEPVGSPFGACLS